MDVGACRNVLVMYTSICKVKARLHRRFLSRQLDAIFVPLKLQLQNRTCEPGAIFSAICRRDIAGVSKFTCSKLDATLLRQNLHRVAATKIACVNGPLLNIFSLYWIMLFQTFYTRNNEPLQGERDGLNDFKLSSNRRLKIRVLVGMVC